MTDEPKRPDAASTQAKAEPADAPQPVELNDDDLDAVAGGNMPLRNYRSPFQDMDPGG